MGRGRRLHWAGRRLLGFIFGVWYAVLVLTVPVWREARDDAVEKGMGRSAEQGRLKDVGRSTWLSGWVSTSFREVTRDRQQGRRIVGKGRRNDDQCGNVADEVGGDVRC